MKTILLIVSLWIISFNSNSQCLQADIILIADYSFSVENHEKYIADALSAFVGRFRLGPTTVRIGLIKFNDNSIITPLTHNEVELKIKIQQIREGKAYGGTSLGGALEAARLEFITHGRLTNESVRNFVIVITDGDPNDEDHARIEANKIKFLNLEYSNVHSPIICGILIDHPKSKPFFLEEISSEGCYLMTQYEMLTIELQTLDICF